MRPLEDDRGGPPHTGDDPHEILAQWTTGTWERPDGSIILGQAWDDDTRYRYTTHITEWIHYAGERIWYPTGNGIRQWSNCLANLETGEPLSPRTRGRAVSAVLSFYDHCETDLAGGPYRLPKRWKITGVIEDKAPGTYQAWVTDALRTAADRYQGRTGRHVKETSKHPQRARLACYLLLAGLRPFQARRIRLENLRPDPHNKTLGAFIPMKNRDDDAGIWGTLPWILHSVITEYLDVRGHAAPHSTPTSGTLLTNRSGAPLHRSDFIPLLHAVAATHPELAELDEPLKGDWVAHSLSPLAHFTVPTKDDDTPTDGHRRRRTR
ncbi:hypothetical protein [Streptomyces noursei]